MKKEKKVEIAAKMKAKNPHLALLRDRLGLVLLDVWITKTKES